MEASTGGAAVAAAAEAGAAAGLASSAEFTPANPTALTDCLAQQGHMVNFLAVAGRGVFTSLGGGGSGGRKDRGGSQEQVQRGALHDGAA